jgi:hypothetical protein
MTQVFPLAQGEPNVFRARKRQPHGEILSKDDVAVILVEVFDMENAEAGAIYAFAPDIDDVLFDTLQQDEAWPHTPGFNIRVAVAHTGYPLGGHRYLTRMTIHVFSDEDDELPPYPLRVDWIGETDAGTITVAT